jgi:hypothetical protein
VKFCGKGGVLGNDPEHIKELEIETISRALARVVENRVRLLIES